MHWLQTEQDSTAVHMAVLPHGRRAAQPSGEFHQQTDIRPVPVRKCCAAPPINREVGPASLVLEQRCQIKLWRMLTVNPAESRKSRACTPKEQRQGSDSLHLKRHRLTAVWWETFPQISRRPKGVEGHLHCPESKQN